MIKFILISLFSLNCWADRAGPIIVGGTGESEFNLFLAQSQMTFFWHLCRQTPACLPLDATGELAATAHFIETASFRFLTSHKMKEAIYVDQATQRIDFNQDLLWTKEGRGFSLAQSFDFLWRAFPAASEDFRQNFLNLVQNQLRQVNVTYDANISVQVINLQNGFLSIMMEEKKSLVDIQSLSLSAHLKCSNEQVSPQKISLGNLSYAYPIDKPGRRDLIFNSHIRYHCGEDHLKAHLFFGLRILTTEKKFDRQYFHFQINSIEKVN